MKTDHLQDTGRLIPRASPATVRLLPKGAADYETVTLVSGRHLIATGKRDSRSIGREESAWEIAVGLSGLSQHRILVEDARYAAL